MVERGSMHGVPSLCRLLDNFQEKLNFFDIDRCRYPIFITRPADMPGDTVLLAKEGLQTCMFLSVYLYARVFPVFLACLAGVWFGGCALSEGPQGRGVLSGPDLGRGNMNREQGCVPGPCLICFWRPTDKISVLPCLGGCPESGLAAHRSQEFPNLIPVAAGAAGTPRGCTLAPLGVSSRRVKGGKCLLLAFCTSCVPQYKYTSRKSELLQGSARPCVTICANNAGPLHFARTITLVCHRPLSSPPNCPIPLETPKNSRPKIIRAWAPRSTTSRIN